MPSEKKPIRVLYSFPHKLGAARICYTAWQQVNGLAAAGANVTVFPGVLERGVPENVIVRPTLAWGKLRIPYRALGTMRALALHDHIVARRLEKMAGKFDIVHLWPDAAAETIRVAKSLGIPTVLERPNAHTRYAYESVQAECRRLGIVLPPDHEYAYKLDVLAKEELEYRQTDFLLCPSEFTAKTFLDRGFEEGKLLRHGYGFDEKTCYPPAARSSDPDRGLTVLFAGVCAVRKGVHFALEAWLKSPLHKKGTFIIAGDFLPEYAEKLSGMLSHPSVRVLGHRNDVPDLMRSSDILVLPSLEEGFGLVIVEALACGCVPMVSEACTEVAGHMQAGLIHRIGDVAELTRQFTLLDSNRALLARMSESCLRMAPSLTWNSAGALLLDVYRQAIARYLSRELATKSA
jgi:glycosyltransferase involved in cell wall biosynthesis